MALPLKFRSPFADTDFMDAVKTTLILRSFAVKHYSKTCHAELAENAERIAPASLKT